MTTIESVWRDEWGRLLALLVAQTRRLDLAEDALADAFEKAARVWPEVGMPDNPPAWLLTTARRRVIDHLRAEAIATRKQPLLVVEEETRGGAHRADDGDDLLRLVLLAAHPALSAEAGAALTLRLVLGISTADIARLFLVSESTMAARLTRARKKVVAAGIPFALPEADVLVQRLDIVAKVAYLAFTAGYAPGSGLDAVRVELAGEAIRLVRLVRGISTAIQANPALTALLALMLLQHSRRHARMSPSGKPVLLPDQDRTRWHPQEIDEGLSLLREAMRNPDVGGEAAASYLLQALIAAEHARASDPRRTDWSAIADLYRQLEELTGSPVVRLNRAVAVAEAGDVERALALLDGLHEQLPRSHRLPAVRAELNVRRGDLAAAGTAYDEAIELCDNEAERALLRETRDRHADGTGR